MAEKKEKQYVSDNAQLMAEWDWERNIELGMDPQNLTCGISMPYSYAQALVAIAKGETDKLDESIIAYLEKCGYIKKDGESYIPTFLVMFKSKNKTMPPKALETLETLRSVATKIAMRHYLFCREQIHKEIPTFLEEDEYQIDHACANVFNLRGAILEEALRQGYISYADNDERKMFGTFLSI